MIEEKQFIKELTELKESLHQIYHSGKYNLNDRIEIQGAIKLYNLMIEWTEQGKFSMKI